MDKSRELLPALVIMRTLRFRTPASLSTHRGRIYCNDYTTQKPCPKEGMSKACLLWPALFHKPSLLPHDQSPTTQCCLPPGTHQPLTLQFVKVPSSVAPSVLFELLLTEWHLPAPNLVVSLVGEERPLAMKSWLRDVLRKGLVKAAQSTGKAGSPCPQWVRSSHITLRPRQSITDTHWLI